METNKVKMTWYGRCCFLVEINGLKILTDPHDTFDDIDMGTVKADYTLISSTWHDHGHIGASPSAVIISEPSNYKLPNNITLSGIETKENRGTRNVIFNIKWKNYSITNFADLGDPKYLQKLSNCKKKILASTKIMMARPNPVLKTRFTSIDLALKVCTPKILIPHHNYPPVFARRIKGKLSKDILKTYNRVDIALERTAYIKKQIKGSSKAINLSEYKEKTALLFQDVHKQVKQI